MRNGSVWISEDEETAEDDHGWILTGRFSGFHDTGGTQKGPGFRDLDLDAAIAWGRERADRVYLTFEGERYDASISPANDYPPLPADLPRPARRRPAGEEWKDRTEADEPIDWVVAAWLRLAGNLVPDRDRDAEVAAIAERTGAAGWDADELDAARADMDDARRATKPGEPAGWFSYHRAAFRITYVERAPTRTRAMEQAAQRCGTHAGWTVELDIMSVEPLSLN